MPSKLSSKFYDLMRKHLENGIPIREMAFNKEQKRRAEVCTEAYARLRNDPYFDVETYLRNRYNRTVAEISNDMDCINFMMEYINKGTREISRFRVRRNAEIAMKMAYDQGNVRDMISAGKQLSEIERLNEPEQGEDLENNVAKLPPVFTPDPRKVLPDKTYRNPEQMERIRRKWGVQMDPHQQLVAQKMQGLEAEAALPPETAAPEPLPDRIDDEDNEDEERTLLNPTDHE